MHQNDVGGMSCSKTLRTVFIALIAICATGCSRPLKARFIDSQWWEPFVIKNVHVRIPKSGPKLFSAFKTCLVKAGIAEQDTRPENIKGVFTFILSDDEKDGAPFSVKLNDGDKSKEQKFHACGDKVLPAYLTRAKEKANSIKKPEGIIRGFEFEVHFPLTMKLLPQPNGEYELHLTSLD